MSRSRNILLRRIGAGLLAVLGLSCGVLRGEEAPSLTAGLHIGKYSHRRYSVRNGLPSDWINDILQTRDGFVWVATENGLARFDGAKFRVFNRTNSDLPINQAWCLLEARDGTLWIGSKGGLANYRSARPSPVQRIPSLDQQQVQAVFEDHRGWIWIGTVEQTWVGRDGAHFEVVEHAPRNVRAICEDHDRRLWIGSRDGTYRGPGDAEFEKLPVADVQCLLVDDDGTVEIGTHNEHLEFRDGEFRSHGKVAVYDLLRTRTGGLYRCGGFTLQRREPDGSWRSLTGWEAIWTVHEDSEGGLWVGRQGGQGLSYFRNAKVSSTLNGKNHLCVKVTRDDSVWFGTNEGLHRLRDGKFTHFGLEDGLPGTPVHTIAEEADGALWVGTEGGLARCDEGVVAPYTEHPEFVDHKIVVAFVESSGPVWFVVEGQGTFVRGERSVRRVDELSPGNARWFHEDSNGDLWIGHDRGLFRRKAGVIGRVEDPGLGELHSSSFEGYYAEDDGTLWVGTWGGIARHREGRFESFTAQHGLRADHIERMHGDTHGNLWLAGRHGLYYVPLEQFDEIVAGRRSQLDSKHVGRHYYLAHTAGSHSFPRAAHSADGTLWMSTPTAAIKVPPEPIWQNRRVPPVHIEGVTLDGEAVVANPDVRFESGIHRLGISFSAPTFTHPAHVEIHYRLKNHDEDWLRASDERIAYYTELRPGEYEFQVIASNGDGTWNREGASIQISVIPRWWERPVFRIGGLAGAFLALGLFFSGQLRRARRTNRELQEYISQRQRAEEESQRHRNELARVSRVASMGELTTSVAHEVKQPLFAIVSNAQSVQRLLDHDHPDLDEVRDAMQDIAADGNRASQIIDHIRSLVRKEALPTKPLDLSEVARQALDLVDPEFRQRGLAIDSELASGLPPIEGNPIELQQVILNLLINGLQAMEEIEVEAPELKVSTWAENGAVHLSVADRGPGLDEEQARQIFQPFFTTKPQGTGIGLSINRTIVEAHGGKIWADPNPPRGATFRVQLPVSDARL